MWTPYTKASRLTVNQDSGIERARALGRSWNTTNADIMELFFPGSVDWSPQLVDIDDIGNFP